MPANMSRKREFSILHVILFFVYASFLGVMTYLPIFLKDQVGLSDAEIAIGTAGFGLMAFLGSFFVGRFSDMHGRRQFIRVGLLFSGIIVGAHAFIWDFWSFFFLRALAGLGMAFYIPTLIALARELKFKMGRFTSFGSLGWLFGVLASGILAELIARQAVFILAGTLYLVGFILSLFVTEPPDWTPLKVPFFPFSVIKRNWALMTSFLLRHGAAMAIWTLWPIFLKRQVHASDFQISIIQAINTGTQFMLMYFLMDKGRSKSLVLTGLIVSSITFFSFTLITDFYMFLFTQVLLGISWAFLYAGSVRYITERNPELGTASGLLNGVISLSQIAGPMIATFLSLIFPEDYYLLMDFAVITTIIGTIIFLASEFINIEKKVPHANGTLK